MFGSSRGTEKRTVVPGQAAAGWVASKSPSGKVTYSLEQTAPDASVSLSPRTLTDRQVIAAHKTQDLRYSQVAGSYVTVDEWERLNAIPVALHQPSAEYVALVAGEREACLAASRNALPFTDDLDAHTHPLAVRDALAGVVLNTADQQSIARSPHAKWIARSEYLEQETQDLLSNSSDQNVRSSLLSSVFVTSKTLTDFYDTIRVPEDNDETDDADEFAQERCEIAGNYMAPAELLAEIGSYPEDGPSRSRSVAGEVARATLAEQEKHDTYTYEKMRSRPNDIAAYKRGRRDFAYDRPIWRPDEWY